MYRILLPALFFSMLFISCSEGDGGGQGAAVPSRNEGAGASTVAPSPSGVALNPPHGEPGHVCEIGVGEPLDGSGSGGNNAVTIDPSTAGGTSTMITPNMGTPGSAPSGSTPPGMNPPHGEPGHVCEIPVGDPLP